jgi:hypothetical protein
LEVQPEPKNPEAVFAGAPLESVWMWNRRFSPVQYISDPNTLKPEDPDWLRYSPAVGLNPDAQQLGAVLANHCYLIKATNSTPFVFKVQGVPYVKDPDWIPDSLNFVGFHMATGNSSFASVLQIEPALKSSPVYRLTPAGNWVLSQNPATEQLQPGEAFWVKASGSTTYSGPLG